MKQIIRMNTMTVAERLKEFMENEARSCSMDYGCITPEYVYRMWVGSVAIEEIEEAMEAVSIHGKVITKNA